MKFSWPFFCGGSNISQSSIADNQETVNWYQEPRDVPGGKTPFALYPTPGVETKVTAVETPGRAIFHQDGRAFTVIGDTFYEITIGGSGTYALTSRGTVAVDANPATICGNGEGGGQLFITSGDVGYGFVLSTNTFSTERASGNTMGAMLDGFFLVLDAVTSTFYVSDLFDVGTWDPTQFAQRSTAPDRWVAMIVPKSAREIWLLGDETSEVWNNVGTAPFPFAPIPNALMAHGCAAPFSAKESGTGLMWVAKTAEGRTGVVIAEGGRPETVSSFATMRAIDAYTTVSDAIGGSYAANGHTFYLLTFPAEDATWTFDLTTKVWAKRGTWISASNAYEAWRPRYHCFAFGVHLSVDGTTGAVYQVSDTFGLDVDGLPIRRMRRTPSLYNNHESIAVSCIEVVLESGVASYSGTPVVPVMVMRLSRDGGKTWGSERTRSIGNLWEYLKRVRWWRCGSGQDIVGEFVVTDPVPFRIIDALVTVRDTQGVA